MNTSATRSLPFGDPLGPRSRRAVQAINNEHFGYAVPETRRRAVQAINRLIRKMRMHALYKGDPADALP